MSFQHTIVPPSFSQWHAESHQTINTKKRTLEDREENVEELCGEMTEIHVNPLMKLKLQQECLRLRDRLMDSSQSLKVVD